MLYGVEKSTDLRDPRTQIKKFTSERALLNWMKNSGGFTYEDPALAQNYHHTFRYGYRLAGRIDKKDEVFNDRGTSTYPVTYNDQIARYLYRHGTEINLNLVNY